MAKKETSRRISSQAGRWLKKLPKRGEFKLTYIDESGAYAIWYRPFSMRTLRGWLASLLSQDETPRAPGVVHESRRHSKHARGRRAKAPRVDAPAIAGPRGDVRIGSARSDSLNVRNPNGRKKRKGARR